jgi:rhamnose utilization protein RhaD (predicted bifunctional aldolase and dehydrogenase)
MINPIDFKCFVRVCSSVSQRGFFWIQSNGGNVSLKRDGKIFIKGSGLRLDEIQKSSHLAVIDAEDFWMNLEDFKISEEKYEKILNSHKKSSHAKPSMESAFHATLPFKWVVHFHSLAAVLLHSLISGEQQYFFLWYQEHWEKKLGKICLVPYLTPGLELSRSIFLGPSAQVFVLQNHGVILASNNEPNLDCYEDFEKNCFEHFHFTKFSQIKSRFDVSKALWSQKIYMPDLAVGLSKMKNFFIPKERGWCLKTDADTNLQELFSAAAFLECFSDIVNPLSTDCVEKIVQLPSEKHRIGILEK